MPKTDNKPLAIAIRKARERLNETQTEFASRIGVNQATISRWEEIGPRGLSRNLVERILQDIDRIHPHTGKLANSR